MKISRKQLNSLAVSLLLSTDALCYALPALGIGTFYGVMYIVETLALGIVIIGFLIGKKWSFDIGRHRLPLYQKMYIPYRQLHGCGLWPLFYPELYHRREIIPCSPGRQLIPVIPFLICEYALAVLLILSASRRADAPVLRNRADFLRRRHWGFG